MAWASCTTVQPDSPTRAPKGTYWLDSGPGRHVCYTEQANNKESRMAKNHYVTKPKRRNRSGKRKDTKRIAANMAKIRELEKASNRTE